MTKHIDSWSNKASYKATEVNWFCIWYLVKCIYITLLIQSRVTNSAVEIIPRSLSVYATAICNIHILFQNVNLLDFPKKVLINHISKQFSTLSNTVVGRYINSQVACLDICTVASKLVWLEDRFYSSQNRF